MFNDGMGTLEGAIIKSGLYHVYQGMERESKEEKLWVRLNA
jgi:hypothetical protein